MYSNCVFLWNLRAKLIWKNYYTCSLNCSLNWQHQLCKNPKPNPDIKTLFVDHTCGQQPNGARAPSPVTNQLMGSIPKVGGFPPIGGPGVSVCENFVSCSFCFREVSYLMILCYCCLFPLQPFQHAPAPLTNSLAGWMANPTSVPHQAVSIGPMGLTPPNNAGNISF